MATDKQRGHPPHDHIIPYHPVKSPLDCLLHDSCPVSIPATKAWEIFSAVVNQLARCADRCLGVPSHVRALERRRTLELSRANELVNACLLDDVLDAMKAGPIVPRLSSDTRKYCKRLQHGELGSVASTSGPEFISS